MLDPTAPTSPEMTSRSESEAARAAERTVQSIGASPYQRRVFGDELEEWDRIAGALYDAHTARALGIAEKVSSCCQNPMVYTNESRTHVRLAEKRCRSRVCPRCSKFRANELTSKLSKLARAMDSRRLMTLTLVSCDDPLRDQLLHLRRSFVRLRRSKLWRACVTGGVYTVEVTMNRATGKWHPHIHAIVDGSYVPHECLKKAWQSASGGSTIVDIRAVQSAQAAARYVASYVAKSSDARHLPEAAIAEWAEQVHGLRLASTFGNLHGIRLEEPEDDRVKCRHELQAANALVDAANQGDAIAASLLTKLQLDASGRPAEPNEVLADRLLTWQSGRALLARSVHAELLDQAPLLTACKDPPLW